MKTLAQRLSAEVGTLHRIGADRLELVPEGGVTPRLIVTPTFTGGGVRTSVDHDTYQAELKYVHEAMLIMVDGRLPLGILEPGV